MKTIEKFGDTRTKTDLGRMLSDMHLRARGLHSLGNNQQDSKSLDEFFDGLINPKKDDGTSMPVEDRIKAEKQLCELIREAHKNGPESEAHRQLCGIRVDTENNFIRATSQFAELFYEVVTLKDDERPALQNETRQEIDVGYISQDGKAKLTKAVAPQDEILLPLRPLSSDWFGYYTTDIYNGNIVKAALRTVDIAFDVMNKYDEKAFLLMTSTRANGGCFGSFDTTNSKRTSRDFVTNSRIVTANLPTTNDIVLTGNTAAGGVFRLAVIRAIMNYCNSWGNAFMDGPLMPTGMILVPSADATSLSSEIVPTGSTNNDVANQILQKYTGFTYMNVNWLLIPDVTLQPGKCYPVLNKPVGRIYTKPSQDSEVVKLDDENNYERRMMKKITGYSIPSNKRLRALRIDYNTGS